MRLFLLFILTLVSIYCKGQNLVNNPSFEDTIPCAIYLGPPQLRPYYWFRPTAGSSDFFNSPTNCAWGSGVPVNPGGFQYPRTGDAYVGLLIWAGLPAMNRREYIEGILKDTLIQNHKYCCEFYVCCSNTCLFSTDAIGAYFSADSLKNDTSNLVLNVIPQVENVPGNMLTDTLNWMLVSGEFIAQGGEKYITIGNFKDDAHTTLDSNFGGWYIGSYYFIDDVSLTDCTVGIAEMGEQSFSIGPNPANDKLFIEMNHYALKPVSLTITNIAGQKVWDQNFYGKVKPGVIDVSEFQAGIYFITLQTAEGQWVKKFVKE